MIAKQKFVKVVNADGSIAVADYFVNAIIETLQTVETDSAITTTGLPDLPSEGWVEIGMYNYNNQVVFCHQPHTRTIYDPSETPALFTFFRVNSDTLEWIQNEKVELGWKRMYNDVQYECIQAHMTLIGMEPDKALSLWKKAQTEEIIDWYQPSGAHDAFRINTLVRYTDGKVYKSLIDYNTYSPVVYPAGWELTDLT